MAFCPTSPTASLASGRGRLTPSAPPTSTPSCPATPRSKPAAREMINLRNYIEELTGKVEQARKAGLTVAEMQQRITVASLKSLHSNGYEEYLARMSAAKQLPIRQATAVANRRKREYSRDL